MTTKVKLDLAEIRSRDLPRLRATDLIKVTTPEGEPDPTADEQAEIDRLMVAADKYFAAFIEPIKRDSPNMVTGGTECVGCDGALDGFMGSFTWGLTHGEGRCSRCGYPCRVYHRVKDADGEELMSLTLTLQYHPDDLKAKP